MAKYHFKYTAEAKSDVETAATYYEAQLAGLGRRFKNAVKQQLDLLKQNPHTRAIRYDDVRLAVIDEFPYSIHYTIHESNVTIQCCHI